MIDGNEKIKLNEQLKRLKESFKTVNEEILKNQSKYIQHYNQGYIECEEAMKSCFSKEEYIGFLRGNVFKYIWKFMHKGEAKQYLIKARNYLDMLIEEIGEQEK